ncbi:helix-turn-helix domain-containing protein [Lactococcus petauri]|uniref:helix-turn-helix domain-containing protein n=1 Tax=Lactococcus petauri TaxID=1940789 RepID=UPI0018A9DA51|nr:helix-turn-helix transcriptional regulator [Lactococcus petauri]MDC0827020.1 helix-turn-helix transcriptional regulator [Lactococcus petauri]
MNLATILVEERKKKEETQQKVADTLYISRQSLSNWENGKNFPDVPMLIELSNYYDFSLDIIKGDPQFMKKVKKDYELINTKKANQKYSILLIIVTSLILLCILLLYVTVSFNKLAYQHYKGIMDSPLWVPKVFGYGLSINPYNKIGRILTIVLVIFLDFLFVALIIAILFFGYPATSFIH